MCPSLLHPYCTVVLVVAIGCSLYAVVWTVSAFTLVVNSTVVHTHLPALSSSPPPPSSLPPVQVIAAIIISRHNASLKKCPRSQCGSNRQAALESK